MSIQDDIAAVETRLAEHGIDRRDFLAEANLHRSTWDRWKQGVVGPTRRNWDAVEEAVEKLTAGRAA